MVVWPINQAMDPGSSEVLGGRSPLSGSLIQQRRDKAAPRSRSGLGYPNLEFKIAYPGGGYIIRPGSCSGSLIQPSLKQISDFNWAP